MRQNSPITLVLPRRQITRNRPFAGPLVKHHTNVCKPEAILAERPSAIGRLRPWLSVRYLGVQFGSRNSVRLFRKRQKLERLCRYIARPAVAIERLSRTAQGTIRYALKTPYRDGTTHVIFEPLDFLARLASLVPSPRVNLTRYHGVFAPNHCLRARIVPAQLGRTNRPTQKEASAAPRHVAMSWAQRLKRVFDIDIETCEYCGGALKIIASIENPQLIGKILEHLERTGAAHSPPPARAPPD